MVRAYIATSTMAGTAQDIVKQLGTVEGVQQADIVAGECDIIVQVETDSERDLLRMVTDDIQSVDGVARTKTWIVLD